MRLPSGCWKPRTLVRAEEVGPNLFLVFLNKHVLFYVLFYSWIRPYRSPFFTSHFKQPKYSRSIRERPLVFRIQGIQRDNNLHPTYYIVLRSPVVPSSPGSLAASQKATKNGLIYPPQKRHWKAQQYRSVPALPLYKVTPSHTHLVLVLYNIRGPRSQLP